MNESVRMRIRDRNIWVLYAAILVVGVAYGMSIAVLALHLDARGIPKGTMGELAAGFALGIVTFAIPAGSLVARVGAKRTLAGALLGYAVCVGSFPFLDTVTTLAVARFIDGACSVHLWVSAETALLSRASKDDKGLVMSLYAVAMALGYVIGPVLATLLAGSTDTTPAFVVAGVLALSAAALVALAYAEEPADTHRAASQVMPTGARRTPTSALLWRTKCSCLATFSYGYFQASVVLFLPLFLVEAKNIPKERTLLVTAFFAAGMLLMSTFAGRLGDRHGHLRIMRWFGAIGGAMVAAFAFLSSFWTMCAAVFIAGATLASISPVSLALQGVIATEGELGRANAIYNGVYALGMLLGPPISGALFTGFGGPVMLYHLAGLWAVFVAVSAVFATDDPRARVRVANAKASPTPRVERGASPF